MGGWGFFLWHDVLTLMGLRRKDGMIGKSGSQDSRQYPVDVAETNILSPERLENRTKNTQRA